MSYNPEYNEQTWSADEQISSAKLNQMVNNTKHNQIYKPELGPDAPTGIKIARGKWEFTVLAAETGATTSIAFNTDSEDGDPAFSNTPIVLLGTEYQGTSGFDEFRTRIYNLDKDGFDISFILDNSFDRDYAIHWMAIGD